MPQEKILCIKGVSKRFGGTQALKDVGFDILKGEVHAIMGENGAGKSTLIKIISSVVAKDTGSIIYDGVELVAKNPQESRAAGINIVYQELSLSPFLTVGENISASSSPMANFKIMNSTHLDEEAEHLLTINGIDSKTEIRDLGVGSQQIVEIAGALSRKCRLLILDEPTSSLTTKETDDLFRIIEILKKRDVTVIYISHKINEVFRIADRITVLKDGEYMGTVKREDTKQDTIINMMVGRDIKEMYPTKSGSETRCALEVKNLYGDGFQDVSFKLFRGEILGFAGLVGAGRTELFSAIFGARKISGGQVIVDGKEVVIRNPRDAVKFGIGYLPEDRKESGLFLEMNIIENTVAASIDDNSGRLFLNQARAKQNTVDMVERMRIKIGKIQDRIYSLSGGNQQKVLLSRWLLVKPKVLIVDEPTRGIDVGAKQEVYRILRDLANNDIAVVMISSEVPEILGMSDRIITMYHGRVAAVLEGDERNENFLAQSIVGVTQKAIA